MLTMSGCTPYPTLLRTGHYGECWAASFDHNLTPCGMSISNTTRLQHAARVPPTPCRWPLLKVGAVVKADHLKRKDEKLLRRVVES